ncbi:MAG: hypothetical protein P4L92_21130 [Rudaea sp.]|nr:hypothetical protein [Rudaea sp.]
MKRFVVLCILFAAVPFAHADVSMTDAQTLARAGNGNRAASSVAGHVVKPGDKRNGIPLGTVRPDSTGAQSLVDASGLKYFINTDITFSTSSSASGAMSEASYTHAVAATTSAGGTVQETLNDAFDGYNAVCVSLDNTVSTCATGNANFVVYDKNGPATLDATCSNRQVLLPAQTIGSISLSRKVYIPTDDSFGRWLNVVTNNGATAQTVTLVTSNNLGSDANTIITGSSTGSTTSPITDTSEKWVATFQNYSGNTTTDPRLGHVLQGAGAAVGLAGINFTNGSDRPFWGYTLTLQPGQTRIIMNFVTGQPSKAAAATQAARLATLPSTTLECMTSAEKAAVANFNAAPAAPATPVPGPDPLKLALLALLLVALGYLGLRARAR